MKVIRICAPVSIVGLLFFLSGCEKDVPRTDYFPLRDGNHWEYRLLDTPLLKRIAQGQVISTQSAVETAENSSNVDSDIPAKADVVDDVFVSPGKKAAPSKQEPTSQARRVSLELLSSVDDLTYKASYDRSEQVWSKRNGYVGFQSTRGRNYLLILPPHSGYKWVVTGPAGEDLYYEVESARAAVSTPAGQFNDCVLSRQESRDRREIFKYWFAPNVGLVRRSKYFLGEEVFRQELVQYKVNPATPGTRMAEEHEVKVAMEGKNRGNEFRQHDQNSSEKWLERLEDSPNDKIRKYGEPR